MTTSNPGPDAAPPSRAREREAMVAAQIARRGIRNVRLLAAMASVPRELFVHKAFKAAAYEDGPLPIAAGQTISQPYVVALMIDLAGVGPGDCVLEVGAGSGYAAAVMGSLAQRVTAVERHAELVTAARASLAAAGVDNVSVVCGDGSAGLESEAPFDAIIVSAGGAHVPEALKKQLAIGGRLVMPVGGREQQTLVRVTRVSDTGYREESHGQVAFVPLVEGDPASGRDIRPAVGYGDDGAG